MVKEFSSGVTVVNTKAFGLMGNNRELEFITLVVVKRSTVNGRTGLKSDGLLQMK